MRSTEGRLGEAQSPQVVELTSPDLALLQLAAREVERRTQESLGNAEQILRDLAKRLPNEPRSLAKFARVRALQADLRHGDRLNLYHEARSAAERSLALDPHQVDAHLTLAGLSMTAEWNFPKATLHVEKARTAALQPQEEAAVRQHHAWLLSAQGDHHAAMKEATLALDLDPHSPAKMADLAFVMAFSEDFAGAIGHAQSALDLEPKQGTAWAALMRSYMVSGDLESALEMQLHSMKIYGMSAHTVEKWRQFHERHGFWVFYEHLLEPLSAEADNGEYLVFRALVQTKLGNTDRALSLLERAGERRDWEVLWLDQMPELAELHDESRFQDLLNRRGPSLRP